MLSEFIRHLRNYKKCSPHTVRAYSSDVEGFLTRFSFPSKKALEEWVSNCYFTGKTKRTISRKISSLRSYCEFLILKGILKNNPTESLPMPRNIGALPRSVDIDVIDLFFSIPNVGSYLGTRDRAIMEIAYSSGIRSSEISALSKVDIDWRYMHIRILSGKGGFSRKIPITRRSSEWIKKVIHHPGRVERDSNAIFLNKRGYRLSDRSIRRIFSNIRSKCNINIKVTPHVMRHSVATHMLENGATIKSVSMLLGHKHLSTTSIYTKVSNELKKKFFDKYHPFGD